MTAAITAATNADELLRRCLAAYPGSKQQGNEAAQDSIRRVAEHLNADDSEASVCIICLELLKRRDAVWSCSAGCSDTVHLSCIQAWARQQIQAAAGKPDATEARPLAPTWCCPKCRCEYAAAAVPFEYRCYCGKEVNPAPDLWLPAHTCGETCGRTLACGHTCMLLCHPGPCPACPRMVQASCYCGKEETQRRCHQARFCCHKLCGRRHACGHRCPQKCHEGPCPPCGLQRRQTCTCGAETAEVPCAAGDFRCAKPCGQPLSCGRHRCQAVCHAGDCAECPLAGPRPCPCGKKVTEGLSCEDPTPTCGGTCDKQLPCGQHRCAERCHAGPCSDVCRAMTAKKCACGHLQKEVPCCESLRCQRKCPNVRNCGRHACRRRCCDGECPPCQEECGRLLKCRNHRCKAPCHPGACLPCTREVRVSCACSSTSYRLPCGWESRARPPVCAKLCPVVRTCRHAKDLPPHRCHFGPCPPCPHPCGQMLGCGHSCAATQCHDPQPPDVLHFEQPAPPKQTALEAALGSDSAPAASAQAAQMAAKLAAMGTSDCPPCQRPVKRWCQGFHKLIPQPCSDASLKGCGQPCGRRLPCGSHFDGGVHVCSFPCHPRRTAEGPQPMTAGTAAVPGCEVCTLVCGRQRPCGHPCAAECHAGTCAACDVAATKPCHCGKTSLTRACHELTEEGGADKLLCCSKQCLRPLPHCPHLCESGCHSGRCPGASCCEQEVTVRCGCRRLKERWTCHRVQAALQSRGNGSGGTYDGLAALRLLPCDAQCKAMQSQKVAADHAQQRPEVAAKPSSSQEPSVAPRQHESRRRQSAASRGIPKQAAGPSSTDVLGQRVRKLQRLWRRHGVSAIIISLGLLCAYIVYTSL